MKPSLLIAPLVAVLMSTQAMADKAPTLQLRGQRLSTELAMDEAGREHGLMDRTTLAADHSMLFVFPDNDVRYFWMKNTPIPLDILYFDKDRKLVSASLNTPPCKADPCPSYPSGVPAHYVLELAAGTAGKLGVQVGDVLTIDGDIGTAK